MSLKLGTQDIAGISTHTNVNAHSLFDFKWSDHKLNEISWLEASTFSWQPGDVYVTAYNHLVQDLQGTSAETETIGSYTVTFYRATDGHKICLADQEQTVLNIYNTYGVAWYYLLDSANTQFKLPRTKYGFEGLRGNVGDKINESLPTPSHTHTRGSMNITGSITPDVLYSAEWHGSGAFSTSAGGDSQWTALNEMHRTKPIINFNAANTWTGSTSQPNGLPSVYQDNAPVQERATQMYLYFYVGDYTQSAIEQTAGLNAELFNNKLDLNASNLSSQGMSYMSGMGMPSDTRLDLTLGASGVNYTAPANGWVYSRVYSSASGQEFFLRGIPVTGGEYGYRMFSSGANQLLAAAIPVKKGETFSVIYSTPTTSSQLKFFYAVGSESEAS